MYTSPRENLKLERTCLSQAKAINKRGVVVLQPDGNRLSAQDRKVQHERAAKKDLCNGVARFSAAQGQLSKAERWIMKVDGCGADVESFNALVLAATRHGDLEKAEEWFAKVEQINLHPALVGIEPNQKSFDIMIRACSEANDVPRAEKYVGFLEMRSGCRPALTSLSALARACIRNGEARRAHQWVESLVERGSSEHAKYDSQFVRAARLTTKSKRTWDVDDFISLVVTLVRCLARIGNTITAKLWLQYLSDCGIKYRDAQQAFDTVRSLHPPDIIPTVLSGESKALGLPLSPSRRQPTHLACDLPPCSARGATAPFTRAPVEVPAITDRPRPATSQGFCDRKPYPRSTAPGAETQGRCASPGLSMLLDAKKRGADAAALAALRAGSP